MALDRLRAREVVLLLRLTEVVPFEQLARQDDPRALAVRLAHELGDALDVRADVVGERGLERSDGNHARDLTRKVH